MCNNCENSIKYIVIIANIVIGLIALYFVYNSFSGTAFYLISIIVIIISLLIINKWLRYFNKIVKLFKNIDKTI